MPWARALVVVLLALRTFDAGLLSACSCGGPGPPCAAYWRASAVFVGTVIDIRRSLDLPVVRFNVDRPGRGIESAVVELEVGDGMCGYAFRLGERYVVYAYTTSDGRLTTSFCSGTRPAADAADDLAYLEELSTWPQGARLIGTVRRDDIDLVTGRHSDGRVSGARVEISVGDTVRETFTDEQGRYEFRALPPGTYSPVVTLPAGLGFAGPPLPPSQHAPTSRAFTLTHPSSCLVIGHGARTDAQITGVVLTSDGRPADDESITLIAAANVQHRDQRVPSITVRTGADGRFTFAYLPPGTYVVGINLGQRPAGAELDRRAYHPSTRDPARATVVAIQPGDRIGLSPLTLPEWPRERRIDGRVVSQDGSAAPDADLRLYSAASIATVPLDGEGRFSLVLPYGAQYGLVAYEPRIVRRVNPVQSNVHTVGRNDRDTSVTLTIQRLR